MINTPHWQMLSEGRIREGLERIRIEFPEPHTASNIMEIGAALLWAECYDEAFIHFERAIKSYPRKLSSFFGMAGVSKWCSEDIQSAIALWRAGLTAAFQDTAGLGVKLPLLLFVAAKLRADGLLVLETERLMRAKVKDSRISIWPGPILNWLSENLSDLEFRRAKNSGNSNQRKSREWLGYFYASVRNIDIPESRSKVRFRNLVDISRPEWSEENFFFERLWSEEFFIARFETKKLGR